MFLWLYGTFSSCRYCMCWYLRVYQQKCYQTVHESGQPVAERQDNKYQQFSGRSFRFALTCSEGYFSSSSCVCITMQVSSENSSISMFSVMTSIAAFVSLFTLFDINIFAFYSTFFFTPCQKNLLFTFPLLDFLFSHL